MAYEGSDSLHRNIMRSVPPIMSITRRAIRFRSPFLHLNPPLIVMVVWTRYFRLGSVSGLISLSSLTDSLSSSRPVDELLVMNAL